MGAVAIAMRFAAGVAGVRTVSQPVSFLLFSFVGAAIAARDRRNPIGWIFVVLGFAFLVLEAKTRYVGLAGLVHTPGAAFASWLDWIWPPLSGVAIFVVPLLFPTGRLLSARWRVFLWSAVVFAAIGGTAGVLVPGNPLGLHIDEPLRVKLDNLSVLPGVVALVGTLASLAVRFRRASALERQQLKWFLVASVPFILGFALHGVINQDVQSAIVTVGLIALPVSVGLAILKYRLYDIDVVINKSLVYGTLAAFITAVYVGIVVGIGSVFGNGGRPSLALSIVATAIVAVAFQPVRERVQRAANRLVYGKRATPYEVLSQFSQRVAGTYSSEDVLPRMARVLGEGTGASRADVWIRSGDGISPAASRPFGDGPAPSRVVITGQLLPQVPGISRIVPVHHQGELLGALSINKRPGEVLTPIEEKLVADLAAQAGLVLQSVRLTAELQARLSEISQQATELRASRQRIVATQDGERRRLERNIHDGAQQNLVALTIKLRLAATLAKRDPERARVSVKALEAESDQALDTLRALARGIYPPLLREQGLAAAVRVEAEKMPLPARVRADHLDRYASEVEAAVYFVCLEALQNVTKHARASQVEIRLGSLAHELSFEITDDGAGFEMTTDGGGSGLRNMVDRIEGLGGRLEIRSTAKGGTTVRGTIPIAAMEAVS